MRIHNSCVLAVLAVGLASLPRPASCAPVDNATIEDLKTQIESLRLELAAARSKNSGRFAAIEATLAKLQDALRAVEVPPAPQPTPTEPPPASPSVPDTAPIAQSPGGAPAGSSKVFNPDISAIGDFIGTAGKSPGGGEPSLELHEAELGLQAVVDPYARADFFLTFGPDEVGVEEGYVTFPALPGGLLVKAGKMRDAFGKVDAMHNHVLPTADRPIVSRNLLGGEDALADAGISVSRLIPIPGVFLEATGQVFRGESEVFKAAKRADLAYVGHLRFYQDVSESTNVDLGGSVAYGHNGAGVDTTTRLVGADLTFRYKPLRRAIYTHVLARAELVWSRRESLDGPVQNAFGGYGYLEYQFAIGAHGAHPF